MQHSGALAYLLTSHFTRPLERIGTWGSFAKEVEVNPAPTILSSLTPPATCSGNIFNYPLTSSVTGTTYTWSRADIIGISEPSTSIKILSCSPSILALIWNL